MSDEARSLEISIECKTESEAYGIAEEIQQLMVRRFNRRMFWEVNDPTNRPPIESAS